MQNINLTAIDTIAKVMAESFKEDPLNLALLNGLSKKDELLQSHSKIHVKNAIKKGSLQLLDDDPRAFLVGVDSTHEKMIDDIRLVINIYLSTIFTLGWRDIRTIFANNKKTKGIVNFQWQKEFLNGRFFRIKIVAVDKELRETGAFRRLITPVIELSDRSNIPLILETHNEKNVGLYEHFGFELVKTIESDSTDIKQYCMIRKPGP